jgi:hypothetical protein
MEPVAGMRLRLSGIIAVALELRVDIHTLNGCHSDPAKRDPARPFNVWFSFWKTWSIVSNAGGNCTHRAVQVAIVSISGVHSSTMSSTTSVDCG